MDKEPKTLIVSRKRFFFLYYSSFSPETHFLGHYSIRCKHANGDFHFVTIITDKKWNINSLKHDYMVFNRTVSKWYDAEADFSHPTKIPYCLSKMPACRKSVELRLPGRMFVCPLVGPYACLFVCRPSLSAKG